MLPLTLAEFRDLSSGFDILAQSFQPVASQGWSQAKEQLQAFLEGLAVEPEVGASPPPLTLHPHGVGLPHGWENSESQRGLRSPAWSGEQRGCVLIDALSIQTPACLS